ncbi:hypothetical protein EDB83DRAFT_2596874 [Lactarius deliciosus]|nr:hypothetical protein EDB83DRAFT_2596874 [Lactarius deliciosus]
MFEDVLISQIGRINRREGPWEYQARQIAFINWGSEWLIQQTQRGYLERGWWPSDFGEQTWVRTHPPPKATPSFTYANTLTRPPDASALVSQKHNQFIHLIVSSLLLSLAVPESLRRYLENDDLHIALAPIPALRPRVLSPNWSYLISSPSLSTSSPWVDTFILALNPTPLWRAATAREKDDRGRQTGRPLYTRKTTSTALQLAVDHAFTGTYVIRFRPGDPEEASACPCGALFKTDIHILYDCPHQLIPVARHLSRIVYNGIRTPYGGLYRSKNSHRLLTFLQLSGAMSKPDPGPVTEMSPEPD